MSPSPRPRRPLLSAAVAVFAERGYTETSLEDLLAATSLDRATSARRFADNEGCFLAAYDRTLAVAHASLASLPDRAPWAARLAAGLRCLLELIDANRAAAHLVLLESQFVGEAALERYAATLESVASFMHEGRECASAPEHLPSILDSVLPGGVAFSLRCQVLRRERARDLYPELLGFLLLPYLGEAETKACLARSSPPGTSTQLE